MVTAAAKAAATVVARAVLLVAKAAATAAVKAVAAGADRRVHPAMLRIPKPSSKLLRTPAARPGAAVA
ncbi:hypothetical protein Acsp06_20330 [Actinomycetospora sp. NBRC 106375]|nr:hypothetical protein Acsp06_20330 [Actinomycetospora sp. NBRC 106375]